MAMLAFEVCISILDKIFVDYTMLCTLLHFISVNYHLSSCKRYLPVVYDLLQKLKKYSFPFVVLSGLCLSVTSSVMASHTRASS